MVSGSDDGSFRIWDLRRFQPDGFVAQYNWHTKPITSIEWSPHDESSLAVSCADNSVTLWDFSVEEDAEGVPVQTNITLPPQLMFVHQGQVDVKEAHWHPQIPGVCGTTALDGLNIFKPSNIGATEEIAEPDGRNMQDAY
jgi:ribosome assembly protein RRB1